MDKFSRVTSARRLGFEQLEARVLLSQVVLAGVPAYTWQNGCTPTAVGMIWVTGPCTAIPT